MKTERMRISGVTIIKPTQLKTEHTWSIETNNTINNMHHFEEKQERITYIKEKGTLESPRLQIGDKAQGMIISCLKGSILAVIFDLRKSSPSYLQKETIELSDNNNYELYIPKGIAYGYQTLTDSVILSSKYDNDFDKEKERCINYQDKTLNMTWPINNIIISDEDKAGLSFEEYQKSTKKILITGGKKALPMALKNILEKLHYQVLTPSLAEFNIIFPESVENYFKNHQPDIVIHTAGYYDVDQAEIEKVDCNLTNVIGTSNVCKIADKYYCKVIYLSNEHVFDGKKDSPYSPYDEPNPINHYGYTKMLAENIADGTRCPIIIRTSRLFDNYDESFLNNIIYLAKEKDTIHVVNDQIGSPTYAVDLAKAISQIVELDKCGYYHITNKNACSYYEYAKQICEIKGFTTKIIPISSEEYRKQYPESALRPQNGCLEDSLHDFEMPTYQDALIRCLKKDNHSS